MYNNHLNVTLGGTAEDIVQDLEHIEALEQEIGLCLNNGKSEIICQDPVVRRTLPALISWVCPLVVWSLCQLSSEPRSTLWKPWSRELLKTFFGPISLHILIPLISVHFTSCAHVAIAWLLLFLQFYHLSSANHNYFYLTLL